MLELVKIVEEWEYVCGGCDCCTDTEYYWCLPTGERYLSKEEALLALLVQKGVVVEFE